MNDYGKRRVSFLLTSSSSLPTFTNHLIIEPIMSQQLQQQQDFVVSAPAKVIMYGEHAVVHGKASIAAALSLRSYLHVKHLGQDDRTISLNFPDVQLSHTWDINSLPWEAFSAPLKQRTYSDVVTKLDSELQEALYPHCEGLGSKVSKSAAMAFLYAYLSLSTKDAPGLIFTLRSTIPIGSGLGSSASISVCLSAALQLQMGTLLPPSPNLTEKDCANQLEHINNWAFVGEMCIHGNPSGIDNLVSTHGKAVCFRRGNYTSPPTSTTLKNFPELPLLLINTNQPRSTAELVSSVHMLKNSHPTPIALVLDAVDSVTTEAMTMLNNEHFRADESHLLRLGELIRINHGLLVSLGVSHPKLERVRQLVDGKEIGWTKLTGAGGGGCSMTILRPHIPPENMKELDTELEKESFTKYRATLGGDGVGVFFLSPKSDITREAILEATNSAAVEKLVGVRGVGTGQRGWGFYRPYKSHEQ